MNKPRTVAPFGAPQLYFLTVKLRPYLGKNAFLVVCILCLIGYALYIRDVIDRIQQESASVSETYAELMRTAISEDMDYQEMNVVFEEVIKKTSNPIIVTNTSWEPIMWKNVTTGPFFNRRLIAPEDTSRPARKKLAKLVAEFRMMHDPKPLIISETQTKIGYLVFGENNLIASLKWVPVLGASVVAAFLVFAYLAFHAVRVTERSNLWVGLAKETAHQLGTPISSLMGWVEFMKTTADEPDGLEVREFLRNVKSICNDMEHDLTRLRKITARFSQIGSMPALTPTDVNGILEDAREYLRVRMPFVKKRIDIKTSLGPLPKVELNRDLMEWVFENLLKNAIDAIHRDDGLVEITTQYVGVGNLVRIHVTDNGSGISWEDQKRIFAPGYTTKKRGWGLGLTLAKRIVDDYHQGSIYLVSSQKDKGTTFCIELPVKHRPA